MLKPILELLSSSSEALGFCHRFITGSVPVSFFSSFHSQRIHGSFFFSLFNFQGPSCASRFQSLSALDYLTTFGLICQVLFQLFSRPSLFARPLFSRGLTILPHSARFVKYFFQLFSRSHFSVRSLPFGRLDYLTTLGLICQVLFWKKFFASPFGLAALSGELDYNTTGLARCQHFFQIFLPFSFDIYILTAL